MTWLRWALRTEHFVATMARRDFMARREQPPAAAPPPVAGVSEAELRARAQAVVNMKMEAWAAKDVGYGVHSVKVGQRVAFDEMGRRIRGGETVWGEVAVKSPEDRKREKHEKSLQKTASYMKKLLSPRTGAIFHGRSAPAPLVAGSAEEGAIAAALFGGQLARAVGSSTGARRPQHVRRVQQQHARLAGGAPPSRKVEKARRASQYLEEGQHLPPVSGEVKSSQSQDCQEMQGWMVAVNVLNDPRESK